MKDRPLIISLLIGLIVILVIAGVSLLTNVNSLSQDYKKELAEKMNLRKSVEELRGQNVVLKEESSELKEKIAEVNSKVVDLNTQLIKMEGLKNKLEENLKDELMKRKLESTEEK